MCKWPALHLFHGDRPIQRGFWPTASIKVILQPLATHPSIQPPLRKLPVAAPAQTGLLPSPRALPAAMQVAVAITARVPLRRAAAAPGRGPAAAAACRATPSVRRCPPAWVVRVRFLLYCLGGVC